MIATVTADLHLSLVTEDGNLPLVAAMAYDVTDPWAVRVSFDTAEGVVTWLFARQLLTDGIAGLTGDGDIKVWPSVQDGEHTITLAMSSNSGSAVFEIDRNGLVEFLQQTYLAVPTGHEALTVDLDAELALLLG